jgi:hypothetical protein
MKSTLVLTLLPLVAIAAPEKEQFPNPFTALGSLFGLGGSKNGTSGESYSLWGAKDCAGACDPTVEVNCEGKSLVILLRQTAHSQLN